MDANERTARGFLNFLIDCHPDIHNLLMVSTLIKSGNIREIAYLMDIPYPVIIKIKKRAETLFKLWVEAEEGDKAALHILHGSIPEEMRGYDPLHGWPTSNIDLLFDLEYAKEVYL